MITLTNKRTGAAGSTFWNVEIDGVLVATLQHPERPFAFWYLHLIDDTHLEFKSKSAALAHFN